MKKLLTSTLAFTVLLSVAVGSTASASIQKQAPVNLAAQKAPATNVTLKNLITAKTTDFNTLPLKKVVEEMTGYKIVWEYLPSQNPMDKLNLIMASQEDYDLIMAGDQAKVMDFAANGALVDINKYMNLAPNLKKVMDEDSYTRNSFTLKGGLYAIGMPKISLDGLGEVTSLPFIRKDWLDALSLKMPTTVDEFTEVLKAFKNYNNGTGNKTIPLTLYGNSIVAGINSSDFLAGAFGLPNAWNEKDGKLVYKATDPRFKEYLAYLKSLYKDGLLDAEFPANKEANIIEKYTTGLSGVTYLAYWNCPQIYTAMKTTQPKQETAFVAPLTGPKGDRAVGTSLGGFDRIAYIPAVSKKVEHVMKYIDIKLNPDNFKKIVLGDEGVHYTVKDNQYWPILPKFFDERNEGNDYTTGRLSNYWTLWTCRAKKDLNQWNSWQFMNQNDDIKKVNIVSEVAKAPAFPETSKNAQSLNQLLLDKCVKIIAGSDTVDSFDTFLKDWRAAGGDAMVKEYNDWWATFKK